MIIERGGICVAAFNAMPPRYFSRGVMLALTFRICRRGLSVPVVNVIVISVPISSESAAIGLYLVKHGVRLCWNPSSEIGREPC